MKILNGLVYCYIISASCFAQDVATAKRIVSTLSSPAFWGRGYTKNGLAKAEKFLVKEFQSYGLQPLSGQSYLQQFDFPVNTFPGKMKVSINGKRLVPGRDFIVSPESRGIKSSGTLIKKDSVRFLDSENEVIVSLVNKLTWSVSQKEEAYTSLFIARKAVIDPPASFKVDIQNKYLNSFKASNICAMVKGTARPDSMIFITAHYDHLGGLGSKTYFPGANDNASGISLLLGLAKYYAAHPQRYSIGFICFAGEEAGLLGSKYFTDNPMVDLKKIRFLINTDLAGTGEEGITVVNASLFKEEFALLNRINNAEKYLPKVNPRGKAANSDHYWFTEKGVPSFFIYTMGGIRAYHDIYDRAETLPMTEYEDLHRLIVKFNSGLTGDK